MLKSEVCVNGLVTRAAVAKTNAEGNSFVTFGLKVDVPSKQGVSNVLDISVSRDGADTAGMTTNARVEVKGTLSFKKRGEKMYLNLHADEVNLSPASTTDVLTGTLSFRGTIGKNVETKNDKNGKPYLLFSGYSAERVEESFEYTWVRFVAFGENSAVKSQGKIEATGEMELSTYNGKLNISCRVSEVKEWAKRPYQPQAQEQSSAFAEQPDSEACPL